MYNNRDIESEGKRVRKIVEESSCPYPEDLIQIEEEVVCEGGILDAISGVSNYLNQIDKEIDELEKVLDLVLVEDTKLLTEMDFFKR